MNNNKPLFTVGEHILVNNANTAFIIEIHTSNLQKRFKVHYIIKNIDEYNVTEDTCRPVSIIAESNSRRRIFTTTRIPLAPLNSNISHTLSPQTSNQPSLTKSQFRRLQNIIISCRTWKFDKENSSDHPLYIYLKQNKSKVEGWIRNEIPKEISEKKEKKTIHR